METAIIFPLLIALLFGVIEMGWSVDQRQDIRHNAHDIARTAALGFAGTSGDTDALVVELCERYDLRADATVDVVLVDGSDRGGVVQVTLTQDLQQITGMLDQFFGDNEVTATSVAILETDVEFASFTDTCTDAAPG